MSLLYAISAWFPSGSSTAHRSKMQGFTFSTSLLPTSPILPCDYMYYYSISCAAAAAVATIVSVTPAPPFSLPLHTRTPRDLISLFLRLHAVYYSGSKVQLRTTNQLQSLVCHTENPMSLWEDRIPSLKYTLS